MKFNSLSNIITEIFKSANGINKLITSTKFCNIYEAYPHFEDRFHERYLGYSAQELSLKMVKVIKELLKKRIFNKRYFRKKNI